jgi:hypothetical protein
MLLCAERTVNSRNPSSFIIVHLGKIVARTTERRQVPRPSFSHEFKFNQLKKCST